MKDSSQRERGGSGKQGSDKTCMTASGSVAGLLKATSASPGEWHWRRNSSALRATNGHVMVFRGWMWFACGGEGKGRNAGTGVLVKRQICEGERDGGVEWRRQAPVSLSCVMRHPCATLTVWLYLGHQVRLPVHVRDGGRQVFLHLAHERAGQQRADLVVHGLQGVGEGEGDGRGRDGGLE